jgi:hypothetical protein
LPKYYPTGDSIYRKIEFDHVVDGQHDRGTITSTRIGPSSQWQKVYTQAKRPDFFDFADFDVIGVDPGNNQVVLAENVQDSLDLSSISPLQYPNLILRGRLKDSVNLTVPQVRRWQVNYTPLPEGILYALSGQKLDTIKVDEGVEVAVNYVFKNISNKDFADSITVQETLLNNTSLQKFVTSTKYRPLPKYDSIPFAIKINTFGRSGINSLQAYANPKIQKEENYFNNVLSLNKFLTVGKDATNPILDVVFDGVHIMDGDLVSPSPLINIALKDENKYRFKKDTTGLELYLKRPCDGCDFQRISFSDPNLKWYPADETNKFKIEYQPTDLADGKHGLRVQGSDESGNKSGVSPYLVNFEVINESSISNFYPYPNPFSTKTRFVFRLTGKEIPDEIKIIVMTISGKVVREINQDELGPIKLGDNKTEFFWDGTDQFGDKLANGVYLYKVTVKKNGVQVSHRDTKGDKGFHKGFGKMYILR